MIDCQDRSFPGSGRMSGPPLKRRALSCLGSGFRLAPRRLAATSAVSGSLPHQIAICKTLYRSPFIYPSQTTGFIGGLANQLNQVPAYLDNFDRSVFGVFQAGPSRAFMWKHGIIGTD